MNEKLLHTPEGVRDIYNDELKKKQNLLDNLKTVLGLYNFQGIETPTFEYFDIFNRDRGSAASNEMYKFFDRNNNTLVLRPDITPSIARCVAKYFPDEDMPIRLCYEGKTFINEHQHQGKLNEISQLGAELVNDDSYAADAEIIACVIRCLKKIGLKEFQIEVGEVDYFKGLINEAGIDEDTEEKIREYISSKNFFGLSEYVSTLSVNDNIKKALSSFDSLFGSLEMLEQAKSYVTNKLSLSAIERMRNVYDAISCYGYEQFISFDLSMINGYNYYTGIVFRGYTYNVGDAIVKGGRYNNLYKQFSKPAPAVGFAMYIDELMLALSRNKVNINIDYTSTLIIYDNDYHSLAIKKAVNLRDEEKKVEITRKDDNKTIDDYIDYANRKHITELIYIDSCEYCKIYNMINGEQKDMVL